MEFSRPEYGVGSRSLLQGIFPIQVQTQVSHTAGRFFTSWAMREAQELPNEPVILLLHTSNPRTAQEVRDTNSTVKKSACNYTVGPL